MEFCPYDPPATPDADIWDELNDSSPLEALDALGVAPGRRRPEKEDDDVW